MSKSGSGPKQGTLSKGCAYAGVAFSIANVMRYMGYNNGVSLAADMTMGLKMLKKEEAADKEKKDEEDLKKYPEVRDKELMAELAHYAKYVKASYRPTDEELRQVAGVSEDDVLDLSRENTPSKPAFWVARHAGRGEVILTVRGTDTVADALTDMAATQSKFRGATAHTGMVKANTFFVKKYKKHLLKLVKANKARRLVVCGHSLGAGTAALVTMSFRDDSDFRGVEVLGYCFAPPAAVAKPLSGATGAGAGITSVVVGDDVVPRASLKSFEALRVRLEEMDWKRKAQEKVLPKAVVKVNYKLLGAAKSLGKKAVKSTLPTRAAFSFYEKQQAKRAKRIDVMEPLYPPGRVLHLARGESTDGDPSQLHSIVVLERGADSFAHIGLSDQMTKDHGMASYMTAIHSARSAY